MDLDLGADVDAAGRLVEDEHARLRASHLARTTFCWLPPDSAPTSWSTPVIWTLNWSVYSRATASLRGGVDEEPREQPRQDRQGHVLRDRDVQDEAFLVAVLGQVRDAGVHRGGWAREADGLPSSRIVAGVALVDAEQDASELGPPGTDEPGEPEDLAGRTSKLMSLKTPVRVRPST